MFTLAPIAARRLPALLRSRPRAELHVPIEDALEPEMVFALAQRPCLWPPEAAMRGVKHYL